MITLTDFTDKLETNVPTIENIKGHQMDEHSFIWFGQYAGDIYTWSWYLLTFDDPIVDGKVETQHNTAKRLDKNGFIFGGEAYRIDKEIVVV